MKKLIIGSFSLLFASIIAAPAVRAETETTSNQPATQIERLRQLTNGRYEQTDTDTQVGQPETGTDWQQAPTQTEQLQRQTETGGMEPTQTEQPETGTDWQQAPTQTEQLQQQTETEGMEPTQRGTQQAGDYESDAFNLVNSAYRGELQEQGIPSYSQLIRDYNIGQVTAEDVVEAAIEADMVSPETIEDEEYLNAVNLQLEALIPTR